MQAFKAVDRLLFVHYPEVNSVLRRSCVKELVRDDVDAGNWVFGTVVQQF